MNTKWNVRTFSLENFTGLHRSSFVQFQDSAEHIEFQFPTGHTRVGYFLYNTKNNDPYLSDSIAGIHINTNGMRDCFETTVSFLLPMYPYSKKRNNSNKNAHIDDVNFKGKFKSKKGVYFCWYKKDEYKKLTKEKRAKLY